jgi:hypothetical protein
LGFEHGIGDHFYPIFYIFNDYVFHTEWQEKETKSDHVLVGVINLGSYSSQDCALNSEAHNCNRSFAFS